ncbi:MAG: ferrous iron transport protein B [Myxococcales bacterium]|nr:ferrous iron transport protein B [Myxococcales bacterium]
MTSSLLEEPQAPADPARQGGSAVSAPRAPTPGRHIALVGNPNVGKTSLFNHLSGQSARVGNYPGITVERRTGVVHLPSVTPGGSPEQRQLVDVPGTYSLSARSQEERIAIDEVLGLNGAPPPALTVVVIDAGQLLRNLYLVVQLLELRVPCVLALNMVDEAPHAPPHPEALTRILGVPCVLTNGRTGEGIDELRAAIARACAQPPQPRVHVTYPPELIRAADRVADALPSSWRGSVERDRALALWALSSLDEDDELEGIPDELRARVLDIHATGLDADLATVTARYAYLDGHQSDFFRPTTAEQGGPARVSEKVDRVLLHPVYGFAAFLGIMLLLFQSLFTWSDPAIGWIEDGVAALQEVAGSVLPEGLLRDLLTEGVLGGVGNVIVFLPQILLLFFFIGLLEDSGYMARVAYLMDRIMRSLGLHGRAFVPMLSGFACAVPAILATRTMERQRDRLLTMMVVPLMACSARLPVYTLVIAALFPPESLFGVPLQGLLMVAMYLFSVVIALLATAVLGRTVIRGRRVPLILELPPYRLPRLASTVRMMTERAGQFLREAGTVILVCTIALWGLLTFPREDVAPEGEAVVATAVVTENAETSLGSDALVTAAEAAPRDRDSRLAQSYGGQLGKALEPVVAPLGFDWKIATGIIGAFAAREVFISTLALVYGMGDVDDEALPLRERMREERRADGSHTYTPLVGLSLMVFFALACQCMSTLAVVRRETRSWRWPAFMFAYMTALAYAASFIVYQGGRLLGFVG